MVKVFKPRPYQKIIIDHIISTPRCAVWVFMGAGKTAATLEALNILSLTEDVFPALVIAPLRVATTTWPDEINEWDNFSRIRMSVITGSEQERIAAVKQKAEVYTTNYEQIVWLTEYFREDWPYKTVIADEASKLKGLRISERISKTGKRYLQGQGAVRAKAIARIAYTKTKRWINLTGTPASNGIKDVWAPTWLLDFGFRLGKSFDAFSTRWFTQSYDGYSIIPLPHAQKEIEDKLKDICLSLKAEDYFDLKEPIVNIIKVKMPHQARQLYKNMEKEFFAQIGKHSVEAVNAAVKSTKLLQLASGFAYTDDTGKYTTIHNEKINALESILNESGGTPVLVVYQFKSELERIKKAFPKAVQLDKDPQTIKKWNAGKIPILLVHPASAGHGISLQHGSNIIVFFSIGWNLEEHTQVIERLGPVRQLQSGYNRSVFIHIILAENTIEEDVLDRLQTKKSVQEALLDAMKRALHKNFLLPKNKLGCTKTPST